MHVADLTGHLSRSADPGKSTDRYSERLTIARFPAVISFAPTGDAHSAYRGAALATYDGETRRTVELLGDRIPTDTVRRIWATALETTWMGPHVWFHGDVAWGNLLVRDGRLVAVIDFGCCGMGDPACDLAVAWTLLSGPSRAAFRAALGVDDATWARGRGWVL
nr:phosphotransferase [Micromonospora narathiwatensis]